MIMKHECNSTEKLDFLQKLFDVTAIIRETKSAPSNLTNITAVQKSEIRISSSSRVLGALQTLFRTQPHSQKSFIVRSGLRRAKIIPSFFIERPKVKHPVHC